MITWYLARHGQTKWNVEGRLQGWLDSPLTEKGEEGAQQLGALLALETFHHIFVSPSKRAVQTLVLALGENRVQNRVEDLRLREICLGDWQGMYAKDIMAKDQALYELFLSNALTFSKKGAESYQDLYHRVDAFVSEVESKFKEGTPCNILVITHGITLMCLEARLSGNGIEAITQLRVAPNATPIIYRKNSHLDKSYLKA